jgi:hypothetical protein
LHWIAISIAILLVDFATGPFIQVPILFVIPVALATVFHGRVAGVVAAIVLPLARLSFFLHWPLPSSWFLEAVDTAVDVAILIGFSLLVEHLLQQQRAIRVLQGMLPICAFCKKIRDESGAWRQLESFITERSSASFAIPFARSVVENITAHGPTSS